MVAKTAYECWFLAAAPSLASARGLPDPLVAPDDPEGKRYPKAWLDKRMPHGYSETVDQATLSARVNMERACAASSFRKLVRDVARLLGIPAPAVAQEPVDALR